MLIDPAILQSASRRRDRGRFALLALAVFLFYLPALHDQWIWDDGNYVTGNIFLNTLRGLHQIWFRIGAVPQYYPLTHTTFWIEHHLWGNYPLGYHFDNLLLHIGSAILLAVLLRRLRLPGYALAAALWAMHPMQVESVAWVTERKNVLSGFFYFLSMGLALDVWHIAPSGKAWRSSIAGYVLCFLLFIAALLSKSVTASLPAVVLLVLWWKRRPITLAAVAKTLPFFICGAAMGSLTGWMEKTIVGAHGMDFQWSFPARLLIAGRAVCFYLAKLLWPHPLIFIYPRWKIDPSVPWQWLFPEAVAFALLLMFLLRKYIGRGPLVAALFFIGTLVPALGFVNVYPMRYSYVADHFQYLACIAPLAVIATGLCRYRRAALSVLGVLGVLTFIHATAFYDMPTLFADVVAKDPRSVLGLCNTAAALIDQHKYDEAGPILQQCLLADPAFPEAWFCLGSIAEHRGDPKQAMGYYRAAHIAAPDNPVPLFRLAILYRRQNNPQAARGALSEDLPLSSTPSGIYEQIGEIDYELGNLDSAKRQFQLSLAHNPDQITAHDNLAAIALRQQDIPAAAAQAQATLALVPDDTSALTDIGEIFQIEGDNRAAAEYFNRALEIDPNFDPARQNLRLLAPAH